MRAHPLEPSLDEMRQMGEAALELVTRFVASLPDAPASDLDGADALAAGLREPMPRGPTPFPDALHAIEQASAKGIDTAGPGFLGYVPGGGLYASALAAFIAFAMNRFVNIWDAAPAFVQIEATLLRWFADMFEHPPDAQGILTSGGSLANFSAIVTARRTLLGDDFADGTLYTSEQAHHSVAKTAMLAGLPTRNVRVIGCTPDLRIDMDQLDDAIDTDRRAGLRPFCIVANAGTTNTGAIDPLTDLVQVAHERRMWIHVDAAYGGFFQLTERGRRALKGIVGADSVTLDPHKGLFIPYGTGCLLVRDGAALRDAHRAEADYMQDLSPDHDIPNYADYSPELTRDFRGLRVWLPLKLHGLDAFRDALDEKLDLAATVAERLSSTPGFEVPWRPRLSLVAFRYHPRTGDPETFNRALLDRINGSKRVFLSSTSVGGAYLLRVCVLSHRTHADRIEEALDLITRSAAELDR